VELLLKDADQGGTEACLGVGECYIMTEFIIYMDRLELLLVILNCV
jgi:hypothetical protein